MTSRLTERQKWILKFLAAEGPASTNRLYAATSRAAIAQNRVRNMGTFGWQAPFRLEKMGLVECHVDTSIRDRRIARINAGSLKVGLHAQRYYVRYTWSLTEAGRIVADLIPAIHEAGIFKGKTYAIAIG